MLVKTVCLGKFPKLKSKEARILEKAAEHGPGGDEASCNVTVQTFKQILEVLKRQLTTLV